MGNHSNEEVAVNELQRIIDGPWITPDDRLHLQEMQAEITRLRGLLAGALETLEAYAPNHPLVDAMADALEAK